MGRGGRGDSGMGWAQDEDSEEDAQKWDWWRMIIAVAETKYEEYKDCLWKVESSIVILMVFIMVVLLTVGIVIVMFEVIW